MTSAYNDSILESESRVRYETSEDLLSVELFSGYPKSLLYFASTCCMLFVFIGIPGNLITILALARCKKVRNATAIFIINLHVSDLIFCSVILPITAMTYLQKHWTHGVIMCQVYPFLKYVLNATAIFTILAISINRYVIICHPLVYPRLYKRRNISIMLLTIWASSFILFTAALFGLWGRFDLELKGGFCTMLEDERKRSPKKLYLCVSFFGPYFTIMLCYARIWWKVRKTANKPQTQNARPSHLPFSNTQSPTPKNTKKYISFQVSTSGNSITDYENSTSPTTSTSTTPNDEKTLVKFFKAPFRLTRKEVRPKTATRRDKRLWVMIAAVMTSYCISHLPLLLTRLIYKEYKLELLTNVFSHLLEYLGTCMNPVIYVLISKEYRTAYKSLFKAVTEKFQRT